MDKRILIVIGVLAALVLICLVGAVVVGGVVFAATQFENLSRQEVIVQHQVGYEQGVVIGAVAPDGPAARAGMERGDILLAINGQTVNHSQELIRYLAGA